MFFSQNYILGRGRVNFVTAEIKLFKISCYMILKIDLHFLHPKTLLNYKEEENPQRQNEKNKADGQTINNVPALIKLKLNYAIQKSRNKLIFRNLERLRNWMKLTTLKVGVTVRKKNKRNS